MPDRGGRCGGCRPVHPGRRMPPRPRHGGIDGIDETTQPDTQPAGTVAAPPGRFGVLLLLLVATYLMNAFSRGRLIDGLQLVLFAGAAVLALGNSTASRRTVRLILLALAAGTVIM